MKTFQMGQLAQSMTWEAAEASHDASLTRQQLFAALVYRQTSFVFRIAFAVLRNAQDAEDVVQETFLKVYRQANLEEVKDERAYLARIAWRVAVSRRGKNPATNEIPEQPSTELTPEQASASADWDAHVRRLIDSLPPELRDPLLMSATEDLKSNEIAAVLGIPEGTVRNRICRARRILKQKMTALLRVRDGQ